MYIFTQSALTTYWYLFVCLAALFVLNEVSRRWKWVGFFCFVILPAGLSVLWFTVLREKTYTDWFHLAKVYSSTAGCIGFWCIRHVKGTNKITGKQWRLSEKKWALCFPPLILAINIAEACARDFQVSAYTPLTSLPDEAMNVLGGSWNIMNGIAGILNIITITGWLGICIRKKTKTDGSRDMLWPDMLWFWIIAYDIWNFAYTYNCLPRHSFYCGIALLLAPTLCAFTVGKGAWLQHRAQTLALFCMAAQTFPQLLDSSVYTVESSYSPVALFYVSLAALVANIAVFVYMIYKVVKTKRNPYLGELYTDLNKYQEVKVLSD